MVDARGKRVVASVHLVRTSEARTYFPTQVTGDSSSDVSNTLYRTEATKLELPRVVHPVVAAKDETGYGNTVDEQLHMLKGSFITNCARVCLHLFSV